MPKVERTPEERKQFYEDRTAILMDLDQVEDYDPETDENKKAMMALSDSLMTYENLIGICANLARVALERGAIRLGPGKDAQERNITLRDINVLRAAIKATLKTLGDEETEVVTLRRAISRLNAVQIFYYAIYGGSFRYMEKSADKNGFVVLIQRQRYFGGIPEEKLPRTVAETRRDELIERVSRVDLRINHDNAKKIRGAMELLEKEQPVVELPVKAGEKNIVSRAIARAGEAEFFWAHLPKGLKEPRITPK